MPDIIRTLTIKGKTEGVAEVTAAMKGLSAATDNVTKSAVAGATATDTQAKRQLSLADAVDKAERRFNSTLRAQQDFEKVQRQMNAAVAQNPALQDRANAVIAQAAQHYGQAGVAAKAFAAATSGVSGQLIALSAGAGPVGVFLSALGPWGIAAAVGLGVAEKALGAMIAASHELAQKSQELRSFSEVTGLTTAQVQALRSEASKFGVTGDEVQSAVQQFTARFNDLRVGQGELLTQVRRLNPALADQMAAATDAASALTLFGQALKQTDNIFERNALVKAGTGRGGLRAAEFLSGLDVSGVTQSYVDAGKAIDDKLIKKLAQLEIEIAKTSAKAKQNIASIFAEGTLQTQLRYEQSWLDFSTSVKNFQVSGDLRYLLETVLKIRLGGQGTLLGAMGIDYEAGYKAPSKGNRLPGPAPDSFSDRFAPALGSLRNDDPNRAALYEFNKLKDQIAAMGDAATAAQKLDLAQRQLAISGKAAGLTTEELARASGILNASFANQRLQANVAAMGSAATVAEQYTAKISGLQLQLDKGEISQTAFNRAVGGLKNDEAIRAQSDMVAALGDLASPMDQYKLRVMQLQQQLDQGRISQDTFNQALIAANPLFKELSQGLSEAFKGFRQDVQSGMEPLKALENQLIRLSDRVANLGLDNLIKSQLSGLMGGGDLTSSLRLAFAGARQDANAEWRASQGDFSQRYGPPTGQAGLAGSAGGYAMGGLAAVGAGLGAYQGGQAAASPGKGALGGALAGGLSGAGIGFMLGGPLGAAIGAGVGAIGGGILGFLGGQSGQKAQQLEQWKQNQQTIQSLHDTVAKSGLDTNTREGSLAAADIDMAAQRRQLAEQAKSDFAVMTAFDEAYLAQRLELNKQWDAKELEEKKQHLEALADLRRSYDDRVFAATTDTTTLQGAMLAFERRADQERMQVAKEFAEALPDLERALNAERLQIESDFAKKAAELAAQTAAAINARVQGFGDALFGVLNDTTTLEGQLAAIDLQTRREREAEVKAGGEALVEFDLFAMSRRLKIIQDFNTKAVDAEKQAADQRLSAIQAAARNVLDYINNLNSGPGSTLSPTATLANAQSIYNANLALAQAGNLDATSKFSQLADNLEKAARAVYASGQGYQNIRALIVSQGMALPAVQQTLDPVIAAIQATTSAVNASKTQISTDLTIQKGVLDIINASTGATASSVAATNGLTSATNGLLTAISGFTNTMVGLLSEIRNLNTTVLGGITSSNGLLDNIRQRSTDTVTNTYGIRQNTARFWDSGGHSLVDWIGSYARGGWVQGPGTGTSDSVRANLSNGEFVVSAAAAKMFASVLPDMNAGRLPSNVIAFPAPYAGSGNDNREVVSELRAVRTELAGARRDNAAMQAQIATLIAVADQNNVAAVDKNTKKTAEAITMKQRDPRAA